MYDKLDFRQFQVSDNTQRYELVPFDGALRADNRETTDPG